MTERPSLRVVDDLHYTTPLYTSSGAAGILRVPPRTFRNWATGYVVKRVDGRSVVGEPVVTTAEPQTRRGASVPFVGLAEGYMLAAFRTAGVPMQRIRPAIRSLQDNIGLEQALASERLSTDGAEILRDFGQHSGDPETRGAVDGLVVVRSGQQVFRPVVRDYLQRVTYDNGWVRTIHLPPYSRVDVTVDPWINGGQPTVARRGVRVADIVSRVLAEESVADIAYDYDLTLGEVEALGMSIAA